MRCIHALKKNLSELLDVERNQVAGLLSMLSLEPLYSWTNVDNIYCDRAQYPMKS